MHSIFLRYLDEVARHGSIRKAATVLNVSSTSVNRKILSVEEQMGVRFFERSPEGVELTATGKIMLEHCRKTLYDFNNVQMIIDDIRDLRTGHLSIQAVDSFTFSVLPKILNKFGEKYPGISLSVTTAQPEEISSGVASGEIDIGMNFTNVAHPDIRVVLDKPSPFGIIMRTDHPLAQKTSIGVEDLRGYPLVRTSDARGRQSILDQTMEMAAAELTTHMFTNALTIAKQAIQSNRVIGIYTKIGFLEEIAAKELVFVPFAIKSLKEYRIGLIISASVSVDPVKRVFSDTVESVFKSLEFGS
ncbi:MAG: LysR family transcriptional regulator [Rhodobacteraceae bacterium]|nr:LysR family transcriptional regulator [Paracoccaceae bacterium]